MLKNKKILIPIIIISIELIAIIILAILTIIANNSYSTSYTSSYPDDYCEGDGEECNNPTYDDSTPFKYLYIDEEEYGEIFMQIYATILNNEPVSDTQFQNLISISEYYSDMIYGEPISLNATPARFFASSRRVDTDLYAYPAYVFRIIKAEIPKEGCAVFEFSPDFRYIQNYTMENGSCDEPSE